VILNKELATALSRNSLKTTEARSEVLTLDFTANIVQQKALQEADKQRIERERDKATTILKAQTDSEATQIRAEAELRAAKTRAEAIIIEAEAVAKKQALVYQAELNFMREKAKLYAESPAVLSLEKAKIEAMAFSGTQIMSTDMAGTVFTNPALNFFASLNGAQRGMTGLQSPQVVSTPSFENTIESKKLGQ
jgi:regulator of protease activity HflC (stomatin/prohibitin superfamily)